MVRYEPASSAGAGVLAGGCPDPPGGVIEPPGGVMEPMGTGCIPPLEPELGGPPLEPPDGGLMEPLEPGGIMEPPGPGGIGPWFGLAAGSAWVGCDLSVGRPLSARNFCIGAASAKTSVWPSSRTTCRSAYGRLALMSSVPRASRSRLTE